LQQLANATSEANAAVVAQTTDNALRFVAGKSAAELGVSDTLIQVAQSVARSMSMPRMLSAGIIALALSVSLASVAGVVGLVATFARASPHSYYDFRDGTDLGWTQVDNTDGPWAPGVFEATSGSYVLATSNAVSATPGGITDSLFAIMDESSDPQFSNGYLRAKVRVDTRGTRFMLLFRVNGANGYAFSGAPIANNFEINRVDNAASVVLKQIDSLRPGIAVGETWIVEASAVGSRLPMKFWRDGEAEPAEPQLSTIDSRYTQGRIAIGVRKDHALREAESIRAVFDDIAFTPRLP
jgi:hypothetical protein